MISESSKSGCYIKSYDGVHSPNNIMIFPKKSRVTEFRCRNSASIVGSGAWRIYDKYRTPQNTTQNVRARRDANLRPPISDRDLEPIRLSIHSDFVSLGIVSKQPKGVRSWNQIHYNRRDDARVVYLTRTSLAIARSLKKCAPGIFVNYCGTYSTVV